MMLAKNKQNNKGYPSSLVTCLDAQNPPNVSKGTIWRMGFVSSCLFLLFRISNPKLKTQKSWVVSSTSPTRWHKKGTKRCWTFNKISPFPLLWRYPASFGLFVGPTCKISGARKHPKCVISKPLLAIWVSFGNFYIAHCFFKSKPTKFQWQNNIIVYQKSTAVHHMKQLL